MKQVVINNWKKIIVISLAFLLILIANFQIPKLNDDLGFEVLNGNGSFIHQLVSTTYQYYMTWSGRLLTDIESRLILQLPMWLIATIKSIILIVMLWLISILPLTIWNRKDSSIKVFVYILITYWVCNPTLGQTTFWTTGASNYLFTNFYIILYLILAFLYRQERLTKIGKMVFPFISFSAGLSNENSALVILLFSIFFLFLDSWNNKKISINWLIGSLFNLLGASVLLLAPGNRVRLAFDGGSFAKESILEKITTFIVSGQFTDTFVHYGILFVLLGYLFVVALVNNRLSKQVIYWTSLFLFLAVLSNFMLSQVPEVKFRALQSAFIFLLIVQSFFLNVTLDLKRKIWNCSMNIVFIMMIFLFTLSYVLEVKSFNLASQEDGIRTTLINNANKEGAMEVNIPSWYYGKLLRPANDGYDQWFLERDYVNYFKSSSHIRQIDTKFNYIDTNNMKKINFKAPANNLLEIDKINLYQNNEKIHGKTLAIFFASDNLAFSNLVVHVETNFGEKSYQLHVNNIVHLKKYSVLSLDINQDLYQAQIQRIFVTESGKQVDLEKINDN